MSLRTRTGKGRECTSPDVHDGHGHSSSVGRLLRRPRAGGRGAVHKARVVTGEVGGRRGPGTSLARQALHQAHLVFLPALLLLNTRGCAQHSLLASPLCLRRS